MYKKLFVLSFLSNTHRLRLGSSHCVLNNLSLGWLSGSLPACFSLLACLTLYQRLASARPPQNPAGTMQINEFSLLPTAACYYQHHATRAAVKSATTATSLGNLYNYNRHRWEPADFHHCSSEFGTKIQTLNQKNNHYHTLTRQEKITNIAKHCVSHYMWFTKKVIHLKDQTQTWNPHCRVCVD